MKEERLRAVWLTLTSLDGHGAQAHAARRATLGGPAMTLQAAEDLAHGSKVRAARAPHSGGITPRRGGVSPTPPSAHDGDRRAQRRAPGEPRHDRVGQAKAAVGDVA